MLNRLGQLQRLKRVARWRPGRTALQQRQVQEDELLQLARQSFMCLQAAWDSADLGAFRELATAPLLDDLRHQLAQRGPGPNRTEVLQLSARLLSFDDLPEAFLASVEFSGFIREQHECDAAPFRELWMLASVKATGPGWKLARVQALC